MCEWGFTEWVWAERFGLRNFIFFVLVGFRFTFGAFEALLWWAFGALYFVVFASSEAVVPRPITNVNSNALNFIAPFYGCTEAKDKYIFKKEIAVSARHP